MNQKSNSTSLGLLLVRYRFVITGCLVALTYLANLFVDIMEVDAAQYASISWEMFANGSWLEVYHRGADYLDKPPLLFWLSALSFKVFGVANWSYKLPALLVLLLGLYSTYRLARLWYSPTTARWSVWILATTQALFLMTNDVRTDGLLTGWAVFALWQFSAYLKEGQWKWLLGGAVGIGMAMLAKGPIGLVFPALALGGHLLLQRNWKAIFKWQWLVVLAVVAVLLAPMTYGLYQQFDLHPEKEVYGLKGPSGVRFFYWTQSFGRITGENYWKDDSGFFYFFHTIAWDFQPWLLLLVPALAAGLWRLMRKGFRLPAGEEAIALSGFLLTFLALSKSGYKLPHYIFPLFPLGAILAARWLEQLEVSRPKALRTLTWVQLGLIQLFVVAALLNTAGGGPTTSVLVWSTVLGLTALAWWYAFQLKGAERLLVPTLVIIGMFGITLSTRFYPNLLTYQPTNAVGRWAQEQGLSEGALAVYLEHGHGIDFYGERIAPEIKALEDLQGVEYLYTNVEGLAQLQSVKSLRWEIVKTYADYPVTELSIPFLLPQSRENEVRKTYLIAILK
jgi:4-amino-4-deoxy-L-arabinose transferase-like glycosyltransferase